MSADGYIVVGSDPQAGRVELHCYGCAQPIDPGHLERHSGCVRIIGKNADDTDQLGIPYELEVFGAR